MGVIAPIVEGHSEVAALPVMLRWLFPQHVVLRPFRLSSTALFPEGFVRASEAQLERCVRVASAKIRDEAQRGGVLLLYDLDDGCPAEAAAAVRACLRRVAPDVPAEIVFAVREFEAWFLAGGCCPGWEGDAEANRDAKGQLRTALGGRYSETVDPPRLAARMDLAAARSSRSFRQLERAVTRLLGGSDAAVRREAHE